MPEPTPAEPITRQQLIRWRDLYLYRLGQAMRDHASAETVGTWVRKVRLCQDLLAESGGAK